MNSFVLLINITFQERCTQLSALLCSRMEKLSFSEVTRFLADPFNPLNDSGNYM
jgi:hypothetical protein